MSAHEPDLGDLAYEILHRIPVDYTGEDLDRAKAELEELLKDASPAELEDPRIFEVGETLHMTWDPRSPRPI